MFLAATAVFTPKITAYLPARTAEFAANAGVPGDLIMPTVQAVLTATPGVLPSVPGVTSEQILAALAGTLQAYADAFAYVYYTIIPFTVAAAIGMSHHSNRQKQSLTIAWYFSIVLHTFRERHHELEYRPSC